jgi:hypothetical protein
MFAFISHINTWYGLAALLVSGLVILFAHYSRKSKSTRDKHQRGEKRDKQKNMDKKRNTENWIPNDNKKTRKRRKK